MKKLGAALGLVLLSLVAAPTTASAAPILFSCVTNNTGSCSGYANLITGDVSVAGNQLTVTVTNGAGGGISELYADTPSLGFFLTGLYEGTGVDLEFGGAPPNVPGGNTATPVFVSDFMAQASSSAGRINLGETGGLVFTLAPSQTQGQIEALLASGALRFGLHIQSLGPNLQSEGMISTFTPPTTVPEPATMLLLGTGLLAAARARRKKVS